MTMEAYREKYPEAEVFSSTQKDTAYRRAGGKGKSKEEIAETKSAEIAESMYELHYNAKGQLIGWDEPVPAEGEAEAEAAPEEKDSS